MAALLFSKIRGATTLAQHVGSQAKRLPGIGNNRRGAEAKEREYDNSSHGHQSGEDG